MFKRWIYCIDNIRPLFIFTPFRAWRILCQITRKKKLGFWSNLSLIFGNLNLLLLLLFTVICFQLVLLKSVSGIRLSTRKRYEEWCRQFYS